jgi:hypothetical protein
MHEDEMEGAGSHELVHRFRCEELLFAQSYALCIDQSCMRSFFVFYAAMSLVVMGVDYSNAYASTPSTDINSD